MKTIGKIFNVIENAWDNIILIVAIGLLLIRFAPLVFGYTPVVCLSNSMAPTFYENSLCYIDTNYDVSTIKKGDIIAYALSNGSQVTHRVYDITEEGIITKGDANEDVDIAPVSESQVLGENVLQIPMIGTLFRGFPNKMLITLIGFAFGVKLFLSVGGKIFLEEEGEEDGKTE